MRSLAVTLFLCYSPLIPPISAGEILKPQGPLRTTQASDMAPHPSKSKTYNELWTFLFQFDQGSQFHLNFTRANLGPKDPVCGVDAVLTGFKGKNYSVAREYPVKNFVYDAAGNGIKVHEFIHFTGVDKDTLKAFFQTAKKGIHWWVDLRITEAEPGAVWGDGIFKLGEDRAGMFIHVPKAKVQGRIAIQGDTQEVSGMAYMDHTFQTAFVPRLVKRGFRLVQQQKGYEVGQFFEATGAFHHHIFGYGLREQGGVRQLLQPESLQVLASSRDLKVKVPSRFNLTFKDASPLEFERGRDRIQASTLAEFGMGTRLFLKQFMGGEVLTFRGMGKTSGKMDAAYSLFVVD